MKNIKEYNLNELKQELISLGEKGYRAEEVEQSGIKLVDLDKNEGPKDELTFNIFENLNDDDIKRMLEEQIDKDDN